jgi:phosphate-selective porin OprO/OprP
MADEWQRSSTMINCLERSSFANKLWLYDKEKGNPLAAWVKWTSGKHTFDTAVFSGTYDDYIGGWEDSKIYYGSWLGDFSEGSSYELLEYWISYYKQHGSAEEDRLAGGNDWALSLVNRIGTGPWALHSTLAFGDNGDQTNPNREGDFGGIVLMPMYWLKDEKLRLVGRYLYQKADQAEGLKLNSRYAPLADTRDSSIDLNSGRGDEHQAVYLGLNYYLCGENLKVVSGIQHDELQSMGSTQYRGWTIGSSIRLWF